MNIWTFGYVLLYISAFANQWTVCMYVEAQSTQGAGMPKVVPVG